VGTPHPLSPNIPKTVPFASGRLDSWKEIAAYLNRDVRTVQRWEEVGGMPVYRRAQARLKGSPVYAFRSELDAWLRQGPPPPAVEEAPLSPAVDTRRKTGRVLGVAVAILLLAGSGAAVWRLTRSQTSVPPLRVVQLTSYPGQARQPAFSPDGRQVAFSWNGEKQDNYDIYVKFLDVGAPLRLTTHPGVDGWPAWSPDGRRIAFWRWVRGTPNIDVLTVPALGGAERKILQFRIPVQPAANVPSLCWTPDGKYIITPYTPAPNAPVVLALVSVETLETRPLLRPVAGPAVECCPAITGDGRRLAFLRAPEGRIPNVYVVPLGPDYRPEGEPKPLTSELSGARNPMWTGDGRGVLYTASRDGARTLLRVPRDASHPASPVESLGPAGASWAISTRGDRLAYSDRGMKSGIWRVDLHGGNRVSPVVSSSATDFNPEIAPDGKRITFVSNRARAWGVWVSGLDGANPIDVAGTDGMHAGPARWSPDGNQLVFECQNEGNDDVCTVPAGGGAVRRLTRHPARDCLPSWSRDGKWIYFTSNRSGSFQIWKMPTDGSEAGAVQLTKGGGLSAVESADGATVYFARGGASTGIWKMPAAGGEESQAGAFRIFGCRSQDFAVSAEGIYYASSADPEHWFELWLYRFSTGKSERMCRIEKALWEGLSVSPDGRWLLFAATEAGSGDLYMVENFR
jgi:eukaryotic-like serine/threonine-protein kinase